MKSLLKKAMPFMFVFSSIAIAAGVFISKEEVNKKVESVLAPFNNENSVIALKFTDLNIDNVRALDFGLRAVLSKKGEHNTAVLRIQNAGYHYGDGTEPALNADLSLKLDIVKAFGKRTLNDLGDEIEQNIKNVASDYGKKYGEAADVKVVLENFTKDSEGNFESAKVLVSVTVDLNKLPAGLKSEDVEIKAFHIRFSASSKGVRAKLQAVLNPQYKRFAANEPGLKELIEKLLNDDAELYQGIAESAAFIDGILTEIVNKDNSNN